MFRGKTNSSINPKHFGVGSFMIAGNDKYIVIASSSLENYVCLLCLNNFRLVLQDVPVSDINFLSEDEVRTLGRLIGCTLSDFDLDPVGLKTYFDNKGFRK